MANNRAEPVILSFTVDSALLGELGEKLVSTAHVALAELVKNSYDADATKVEVTITPQQQGAPSLVIQDDGVGMSLNEVKALWMKIGTVNKIAAPVSTRFGRRKTGSKGIGRFACRRLGMHLRLTTCAAIPVHGSKRKSFQTTRIEFDWPKFEPGIEVETVKSEGETEIDQHGTTGTRLEIWGGPDDEWKTGGFNFLQRQLAILASNRGARRNGFEEDPGFNVILDAPGITESSIDLRAAVIDACWGTLTAEVFPDGRARLALNAKGLGGTKRLTTKQRFSLIPGAKLQLGILPAVKEEARRPEILANYVLTDIIDEWGGIHVRHNGFRIFPYGSPQDDWLRVDADRGRRLGKPTDELFKFASTLDRVDATRALLNMLGSRNYLGQVDVTSDIPGLIPRIDRQGFIQNDEFGELQSFARFAVEWATIHRENYIRLREVEVAQSARRAIAPLLRMDERKQEFVPKAASYLKGEIRRIVQRLPPSQQRETEKTLLQTVKAIEASSVENQKQLEHLRLVASASTLTLLFAHEVRTVIGGLGGAALRLEQLALSNPSHSAPLTELASQIKETKNRFDNLISMTGIVGTFRGAVNLIDIHLKDSIKRGLDCFRLVTSKYGIKADFGSIANDIHVGPMVEGELYTILLNIISNSVKSLIAHGGAERNIRFEADATEEKVILRILDDGLGLSEKFFSDVFTPFISDPSGTLYDQLEERANPEDASIFGTGSGLGLPIARDIARARGGDVRFVPAPAPWRACVIVELP